MKLMNAYETMKLSNRCEIINWRRWACETFVASRYSATKRHLLSVSISAPYSGPQLRVAPWRTGGSVTAQLCHIKTMHLGALARKVSKVTNRDESGEK